MNLRSGRKSSRIWLRYRSIPMLARLKTLRPSGLQPKVRAKVAQGVGKLRRFTLARLQTGYIARMRLQRRGECLRCGLCCKLLFECPFLKNMPDGTYRCRIQGRKPDNCAVFPIDERDLRERDLIGAGQPCGFRFHDD